MTPWIGLYLIAALYAFDRVLASRPDRPMIRGAKVALRVWVATWIIAALWIAAAVLENR